mgnify:CR=1 FL=1
MTLKSLLNGVLNYIYKNINGIQGTLGVYQLMLVIERTYYDASLVVQVTNLLLIQLQQNVLNFIIFVIKL